MVTYVTPFPCILADDFGRTNEDTVLFLNILANDRGHRACGFRRLGVVRRRSAM